jgi:hypothetical protein
MAKGNKRHGTSAPKVGSPKQGDNHLFGGMGGVRGPGAASHSMLRASPGSHRKHKQKTGAPGKHT